MSGDPYIKENERLEAEIARLQHDIERHIAICGRLATENEKLRATLEWYGNPNSWKPSTGPGPIPVATDIGNRARGALAKEGK